MEPWQYAALTEVYERTSKPSRIEKEELAKQLTKYVHSYGRGDENRPFIYISFPFSLEQSPK